MATVPRRKTHRDRERLLKRGASFIGFDVKYEPWLWAAYRMGPWPDLPPDLEQEDFVKALYTQLSQFDDGFILRGRNERKPDMGDEVPVGIAVGRVRDDAAYELHAHWFPWATPRNVVETAVKFLHEARKRAWILVYGQQDDIPFFRTMCEYGVLRKIGDAYNMPRWPDKKVTLYQGAKL